MKKKLIGVAALAVLAVATAWSIKHNQPQVEWDDLDMENVKAMAINDLCPNGCVGSGNGCYCYGLHERSAEYSWE